MRTRTARTLVASAIGVFGFVVLLAGAAAADVTDPNAPFTPSQPGGGALGDAFRPVPAAGTAERATPQRPEAQPKDPSGQGQEAAEAPVAEAPVASEPQEPLPAEIAEPAPQSVPEAVRAAQATPVPETALRAVRQEEVPTSTVEKAAAQSGGVAEALSNVVDNFGTFLGKAASLCRDGVVHSTGGPVLILAVLATMTALTRRWVLRAQLVTDEDVPEMLYVWGVIAPG